MAPLVVSGAPGARKPELIPGIAVLAPGAAALAVGIGFGAKRQSDASAIVANSGAGPALSAANTAATDSLVADVCFIGAGALGIAGAVLLVTLKRDSGDTSVQASLSPVRDGAALSLGGSF